MHSRRMLRAARNGAAVNTRVSRTGSPTSMRTLWRRANRAMAPAPMAMSPAASAQDPALVSFRTTTNEAVSSAPMAGAVFTVD